MKELSNEPPGPRESTQVEERPEAPVRLDDARETAPEVFAFDGWGLVPLDIHLG